MQFPFPRRNKEIDEAVQAYKDLKDFDYDSEAIDRLVKAYEDTGQLSPVQADQARRENGSPIRNRPKPPKPATPISNPNPTEPQPVVTR